jgi:hypothetical protein
MQRLVRKKFMNKFLEIRNEALSIRFKAMLEQPECIFKKVERREEKKSAVVTK